MKFYSTNFSLKKPHIYYTTNTYYVNPSVSTGSDWKGVVNYIIYI